MAKKAKVDIIKELEEFKMRYWLKKKYPNLSFTDYEVSIMAIDVSKIKITKAVPSFDNLPPLTEKEI